VTDAATSAKTGNVIAIESSLRLSASFSVSFRINLLRDVQQGYAS